MPELEQGRLYKYVYEQGDTKITEIVQFVYMGKTGKAIAHPPGEPGMQDSFAVDPHRLEPCLVNVGDVYDFNGQRVRVIEYVSSNEVKVETAFCDYFIVNEGDLEEI